jgi:2-keto-4-pentenoate hydratase/2-oxohepta-3-ene-1,7-dioic acid hydratase in catechol pathway
VDGRAALVIDDRVVDVQRASGGKLPADPMAVLTRLPELTGLDVPSDAPRLDEVTLGPPVPRPSKILAAGGNYQDHLDEEGAEAPGEPNLFAKLPNALCGPTDEIQIPGDRKQVDWEAELVVVIGKTARNVSQADAWDHVAGVTCGQDISDREEQFRDFEQWTVAKSFDTYAPTGPFLVTSDELDDKDRVPLFCKLNGDVMQDGSTANLIYSVPVLISWTSHRCTLEPGDLFFTGTPGGVGFTRDPQRFLGPGDVVTTDLPGVGTMENPCVAA